MALNISNSSNLDQLALKGFNAQNMTSNDFQRFFYAAEGAKLPSLDLSTLTMRNEEPTHSEVESDSIS